MHRFCLIAVMLAVAPWAMGQGPAPAAPARPAGSLHVASDGKGVARSVAGNFPKSFRGALQGGLPGFEGFNGKGFSSNDQALQAFRRSWPHGSAFVPFFSDLLSLNDVYAGGYPVASAPPVIMVQGGSAAPTSVEDRGFPAAQSALMIELQDGRYVQVSGSEASATVTAAPSIPRSSRPLVRAPRRDSGSGNQPVAIKTATVVSNLPAAVLIFRDGHREEVRDYTIADGSLYARGDFYTDGFWNKKIELTAVNVPATLAANQERNVKFVLPSSPNEVITRP